MAIEYTFRPLTKWPREQTRSDKRRRAPFSSPMTRVYRNLQRELQHLKAENPAVIQVALREKDIRLDGLPRSSVPLPNFPGVIVSFRSKSQGPLEFCCDYCRNYEDNIRAIVLTLERLRLVDLYGVTNRGEQYTGWKALPNALVTPPPMTVEQAASFIRAVSGAMEASKIISDPAAFIFNYRVAAKKLHPDANNGQHRAEWTQLQQAKAVLDKHHTMAASA